jgi:hypothetical protein
MRTPGGPATDDVAIGVDYSRKSGLIRVGLTRTAALIADNLSVNYSGSWMVSVPVFCIGGGRDCN